MSRIISVLAAIWLITALVVAFPSSCLSAPSQWTISSGGNGHFYDRVAPPEGVTWTEARDEATASTFLGESGHLVTVNSEEEWNFIIETFPQDWTWIGLSDEAQEGTFQWVTGEPLTFTRWIPGEPNNSGGIEDYVFYQRSSGLDGDFGWNDFPNYRNVFTSALPIGYVVEFVPEPSPLTLAALGLAALAAYGWRRKP